MAEQAQGLQELFARKDVLEIVVGAMAKTISKYTRTPTSAGTPVLKQTAKTELSDVVAAICFTSDSLVIEVLIDFQKAIFLALYEATTQIKFDLISKDNQDLAGELLNVSFGEIDPQIRGLGIKLKSSFPKTFIGKQVKALAQQLPESHIEIPFTALKQTFLLRIYPAGSMKQSWSHTPGS